MSAQRARMLCRGFGLSVLLATLAGPAQAAPLEVEADRASYPLSLYARHVEDAAGTKTLSEIRALPAEAWRRVRDEVPNFGYSLSAHWFSFSLLNSAEVPLTRYLEVGYPLLNRLDLYVSTPGGGHRRHYSGGDRQPFDARELKHRNVVFPLLLAPGERLDVLLRVQTTSSAQVPLKLWEPGAFEAGNERELVAFGLYGGIMLAMAAYNLFIFFWVRIRAYLYYVIFIACSGLTLMMVEGFAFQVLWPTALVWQEHGVAVLVSAVAASGSLFAASFLRLRSHSRRLDRALRSIAGVALGSAVLALVLPYPLAIRLAMPILLVWIVLVVIAGGWALWRGETAARFYVAAWAVFLVAAFLSGLYQYGVIPRSLASEYTLFIGSALETLLLSFGLADRISLMRRQTAEAQRQSQHYLRRFQRIFQEARYGIYLSTPDGDMVSANEAAAHILGYESALDLKAQVGDSRRLYVDPAAREQMLTRLRDEGHCNGFETRLRHRDGSEVWVAFSSRLTEDDRGRRCIEGSYVDISERRQREQAEQARLVAERERTLALETGRAKAAFLSNVSQQIRTPLTAIIGYGEFLLEPAVDVEQRQQMARGILNSGHHLLDLVNDVLDLSMLDAGRLELDRSPVDLSELLQELEAAFADRTRRKGLSFRIQRRFPLPRVITTDPARVRQILYKLCGNAVKFTEAGGIRVEVSCDMRRGQLRIAVADTGCGIDPEQRGRIFGSSAAVAGHQYGGSGLGLSISRQLAQLLGGDIVCESEPGVGSRFEFSLGVDPAELGVLAQHLCAEPAAEAGEVPSLWGRVLIVDDNPESQRLVQWLVRRAGAEIELASGGEAAVAAAGRDRFELVLLGKDLPGLDGLAVAQKLRAAGLRAPIYLLSVDRDPALDRLAREAGCQGVLYKPVPARRFYQILARHLPAAVESVEDASASFRETLPRSLAAIMQAVARADWEKTALLARQLGRDGDGHGWTALSRLAGGLAQAASSGAPEAILRALEALRRLADGRGGIGAG